MNPEDEKERERGIPSAGAVLPGSIVVEMVYDREKGETAFVRYEGGSWTVEPAIEVAAGRLVPMSPKNNLLVHEVVLFPSAPEEYGTDGELLSAVRQFIHRYVDLSPEFEELAHAHRPRIEARGAGPRLPRRVPLPLSRGPELSAEGRGLGSRVVAQEAEDAGEEAGLRRPMAHLPTREARLRAADRRCDLPLWEAAVQARPAEVLAQGLGIFGVAGGPGFASSEGDAAGWQLMNESLGVRGPFVSAFWEKKGLRGEGGPEGRQVRENAISSFPTVTRSPMAWTMARRSLRGISYQRVERSSAAETTSSCESCWILRKSISP